MSDKQQQQQMSNQSQMSEQMGGHQMPEMTPATQPQVQLLQPPPPQTPPDTPPPGTPPSLSQPTLSQAPPSESDLQLPQQLQVSYESFGQNSAHASDDETTEINTEFKHKQQDIINEQMADEIKVEENTDEIMIPNTRNRDHSESVQVIINQINFGGRAEIVSYVMFCTYTHGHRDIHNVITQ